MALIAGVQYGTPITSTTYTGIPVGTILPCANNTALTRTLLCNGDIIPNGTGTVQGVTADFSALYAIVGSTYGSAGQLPDTRNVFLRGANASARTIGGITYPAVARGTTYNDQMQGHKHSVAGQLLNANGGISGLVGGSAIGSANDTGSPSTDTINGTPRTGIETRPANLGVNYCIAY